MLPRRSGCRRRCRERSEAPRPARSRGLRRSDCAVALGLCPDVTPGNRRQRPVRRPRGLERRDARRAAGVHHRTDRTERSRKDHALRRDHGNEEAEQWHRTFNGQDFRGVAVQAIAPGYGSHLSAAGAVRHTDSAGERACGRICRASSRVVDAGTRGSAGGHRRASAEVGLRGHRRLCGPTRCLPGPGGWSNWRRALAIRPRSVLLLTSPLRARAPRRRRGSPPSCDRWRPEGSGHPAGGARHGAGDEPLRRGLLCWCKARCFGPGRPRRSSAIPK